MFPKNGLLCTLYARNERHYQTKHQPSNPIPRSHCSIVVSIPTYHAGDPGSIPVNCAVFGAIVLSRGQRPRFPKRGLLRTLYAQNERHYQTKYRPSKAIPRSRCSILVSIPACHVGNSGSIPDNGAVFGATVL